MPYIPVGLDAQRSKIKRAMKISDKKAQKAYDDFELAKGAEARAKSKRNIWGKVVGGLIGLLGGPLGVAIGYAAGGALGNIMYETDAFGIGGDLGGGSQQKRMEEEIKNIELEKEKTLFTDVRQRSDIQLFTAEEYEKGESDISFGKMAPEMMTDFLTAYSVVAGPEGMVKAGKAIKDAKDWKEAIQVAFEWETYKS